MVINYLILLSMVLALKPVEIFYSLEAQQKTSNIMVSSLFLSSHKKTLDEIAIDLSKIKWPDSDIHRFNVTLLTERNSILKVKETDTFHLVELDYNVKDIVDKLGQPITSKLIAHENKLINDIVRRKN